MGKIVLESAKPCFGFPSYRISYFQPGDNNFSTSERVYCHNKPIDGHWLIRVGEHESATGIQKLNLNTDFVIAVTSREDRIPAKILKAARDYAQSQVIPQNPSMPTRVEDLTLEAKANSS